MPSSSMDSGHLSASMSSASSEPPRRTRRDDSRKRFSRCPDRASPFHHRRCVPRSCTANPSRAKPPRQGPAARSGRTAPRAPEQEQRLRRQSPGQSRPAPRTPRRGTAPRGGPGTSFAERSAPERTIAVFFRSASHGRARQRPNPWRTRSFFGQPAAAGERQPVARPALAQPHHVRRKDLPGGHRSMSVRASCSGPEGWTRTVRPARQAGVLSGTAYRLTASISSRRLRPRLASIFPASCPSPACHADRRTTVSPLSAPIADQASRRDSPTAILTAGEFGR